MNSILRKTLIAAAVAGTFGANAATISSVDANGTAAGIQQVISAEGLAIAGNEIVVGNEAGTSTEELQVSWTPAINHADGDAVIFTFTNASIDSSTAVAGLALVNAAGVELAGTDVIGLDVEDGTVTVSISDASLSAFDTVETTPVTAYLHGVTLDMADATGVAVSSYSQRNQIQFDQATATSVASVASQFSLGATADDDLNGEIDVTASRFTFTNGEDTANTEDTFDITVATSSQLLTATATSVVHTVETTGNFDWTLDAEGDFDTGTVDSSVAGATAISESLNDDMDELTITVTGDVDNVQGEYTFDVPGDVTLVESSYSASTTVNYSLTLTGDPATAGTLDLGDTDIGAWTLSGTTHFIEFFPTGSGLTQFVYVANTGNVDAGIEMSVLDNSGDVYTCGDIGVEAASDAVTSVGPAIVNALDDCGVTGNRLAITLTINANSTDIDVTAGYNSRGDRVLID